MNVITFIVYTVQNEWHSKTSVDAILEWSLLFRYFRRCVIMSDHSGHLSAFQIDSLSNCIFFMSVHMNTALPALHKMHYHHLWQ